MRKTIISLITSCIILFISVDSNPLSAMEISEDENTHSMHTYEKSILEVEGKYYVGKMQGKDLWIAMERICDENIKDWTNFAEVQSCPQAEYFVFEEKGISTSQGTTWFEKVLKETSYTQNEIWVAYITSCPYLSYTPNKFSGYGKRCIDNYYKHEARQVPLKFLIEDHFANYIKMFVTVTSSPTAKITSHMGIAKSAESFLDPVKDVSMDLHAFCAKVMLQRNPERRYMVNAPATIMEYIMAMNTEVYIGTRERFEYSEKCPSLCLKITLRKQIGRAHV